MRSRGKTVVRYLGSRWIHEVDTALLKWLAEKLRLEGMKDSTINGKLEAASQMLRFALRREWIDGLPVIPRVKQKRSRRPPLRMICDWQSG